MSRPPLRLIDSLRERADENAVELASREVEARAHVARLRLVLQMKFWQVDEFAPVKRLIAAEVESYARKFEEDVAS